MKRTISLIFLICTCALTVVAAENRVIKKGRGIGAHLGETAPLARNYGRPSALLESLQSAQGRSEVMMWKVGDGVLVIEASFGAGIINSISYILTDANGKGIATFTVKAFDPATGEMTIIFPNR